MSELGLLVNFHVFTVAPCRLSILPPLSHFRIKVVSGQVLGCPGIEKAGQLDRLGGSACPRAGSSAPSSELSAPHAE